MSTDQQFTAHKFDDKTLRFTATSNGDISADTFQFNFVDGSGNLIFRKITGSGITITNNGSVSTPGVVEVSLVDALDIVAGDYSWELRRTNTGRENTLADGTTALLRSFRDLVVA